MATQLFAAIDVGSFELELGIYEITPKDGLRQIDHLRHVIALGRDTYRTGKISYELVDEMCRVLTEFSRVMKEYHISNYRAYATSAMREAKNSQIILDQIKVRTGIDVKVLSNSEQRFLGYKAIAMKNAEFQTIIQKGTAIVDVGFGSMQISMFDKDSLVSTQNLRLGVLRIQETLAKLQTNNQLQQTIIEEIVDNELETYRKMYLKDRESKNRDVKHLIAIGESILFLARSGVTNTRIEQVTAADFNAYYEQLVHLSMEQIEDYFGVNTDYAKLLIPAAIIYRRVLELIGAEMIWIPGIRLCDGIAAEYAEGIRKLQFKHNFDEDIVSAARNMAKRYRCNGSHAKFVESQVQPLFDGMKKYSGLNNRDRLLLQIAAIIHGCGKFISTRNIGESAYNIIMATEIIGLSHKERKIIANVVRFDQEAFDYNKGDIRTAKLTAMMRLLNALDRSHKQKLTDCRFVVKENDLVISASYTGDISLEKLAVDSKADFFEEIFGIRPVLRQKRRV